MSDSSTTAFLTTLWRMIDSVADSRMETLRTGLGAEFNNPFTGKKERCQPDGAAAAVHELLAKLPERERNELIASFEVLLRETAMAPIFHLLSAFDGEGYFENEAFFEVHDHASGRTLEGLHEAFFPLGSRRSRKKRSE